MADTPNAFSGADAWMKFWSDAMGKMSGMAGMPAMPGMPAAPGVEACASAFSQAYSPAEMVTKMQQAFLEAWAKSLDQYMRSETFLAMMKKSMENALAMRQQMDDLLRKTLHMGQSPSRADTSDIMQFLHSFEDRVLDQLTVLTRRVDEVEAVVGEKPKPASKTK